MGNFFILLGYGNEGQHRKSVHGDIVGIKIKGYKGRGTFARGIHPPDNKHLSRDVPIRVMPTPDKVVLSLHQNVGTPCKAVVKARQTVQWGELVGEGSSFVSAALHASVPGTIQRPMRITLVNGRHMDALPIKTKGESSTAVSANLT